MSGILSLSRFFDLSEFGSFQAVRSVRRASTREVRILLIRLLFNGNWRLGRESPSSEPCRGLHREFAGSSATGFSGRLRVEHLTGSAAVLKGIVGASMGRVLTASLLLGSLGFLEIVRAARSRRQTSAMIER